MIWFCVKKQRKNSERSRAVALSHRDRDVTYDLWYDLDLTNVVCGMVCGMRDVLRSFCSTLWWQVRDKMSTVHVECQYRALKSIKKNLPRQWQWGKSQISTVKCRSKAITIMASSSPPHNPSFFFQRINSVDSSSSAATTKERTNTADSTKEGFLLDNNNIISPSHSKDDDFSSVEDDAGRRQDSQINDDVAEQRHEEYSNLEASDPLLLEALAPGESSSPTATGSTINNNSKGLAGRKFDLCGSMYKRRGGFGRNAENNWQVVPCFLLTQEVPLLLMMFWRLQNL